jgi:hypothetical protein
MFTDPLLKPLQLTFETDVKAAVGVATEVTEFGPFNILQPFASVIVTE